MFSFQHGHHSGHRYHMRPRQASVCDIRYRLQEKLDTFLGGKHIGTFRECCRLRGWSAAIEFW
jgi:hypothetical protein